MYFEKFVLITTMHFFTRNVTKGFGKTVREKSWQKLWSATRQNLNILY